MSSTPFYAIGSVIADRYEVLGALGAGKHGEVWQVRDMNLDDVYALKLLDPNQVLGPWEEAKLLNSLSGDFIVPIRNADTTPEGIRYLVTDLAERGTLKDQLDSGVGLAEEQAVRWVRDACNGLSRVHRHGLLHRDVKPENLFITEDARCTVGDLSLAGAQDANGCAAAGGTLETMAPEVGAVAVPGYRGPTATYSVRSEVFSIAATLYWMLTGRPAVSGSCFADAAMAVPRDLWDLAPHVSRGARDITMRGMAPDPASRFATAADLAAALGSYKKQKRQWRRIRPHAGHHSCFEGTKGGLTVLLCCRPESHDMFVINVTYSRSGRHHPEDGRKANGARLAQAIRSVMRALE